MNSEYGNNVFQFIDECNSSDSAEALGMLINRISLFYEELAGFVIDSQKIEPAEKIHNPVSTILNSHMIDLPPVVRNYLKTMRYAKNLLAHYSNDISLPPKDIIINSFYAYLLWVFTEYELEQYFNEDFLSRFSAVKNTLAGDTESKKDILKKAFDMLSESTKIIGSFLE